MALDSKKFLEEMFGLVAAKHSRDHEIFGLIERGELTKPQLRGFIKQFYLLFPKPFPKPIAAMYARSPEDSELERMWMENLMEEAVGGQTDTAGHRDLYISFAESAGIPRDELEATKATRFCGKVSSAKAPRALLSRPSSFRALGFRSTIRFNVSSTTTASGS